ncbi:MAG TPA: GNAT family N-acetyltransferase [Pyrinomonadaceae bacterium]
MLEHLDISVKTNVMTELEIRKMQASDWDRVRAIYLEGIATGHATFETGAPSFAEWDQAHLSCARLVAQQGDATVGWAALSPVSQRCVYGGVAEVSVYVSTSNRGSGVGRQLLEVLINESEQNGIWTLQAGIFPENVGSLVVHRACGFREVGRRERIGKMNGEWRDAILLERRSSMVGID